MIQFTILGEPASKANSRKVVKFGERAAMIKSDKARGYESTALRQIPSHARQRLAGTIKVTIKIYYASQRPDLDESLILDILQDRYKGTGDARRLIQAGCYQNDRQVREKHVYHAIDKLNPRAEITIEAITDAPELPLPKPPSKLIGKVAHNLIIDDPF